jgi:hypothetical protein
MQVPQVLHQEELVVEEMVEQDQVDQLHFVHKQEQKTQVEEQVDKQLHQQEKQAAKV